MAIPITIPRLGWDMEQGVFLGWLKAAGAQVRSGDVLFTLESDKSTEDIECLDEGVLHIPADGPKAGDKLLVGTVIGYLAKPGEAPVPAVAPQSAQAKEETGQERPAHQKLGGPDIPVRPLRQSPHPAAGTPSSAKGRPPISPRAKRLAGRQGIDWTTLTGTGRTGRIRERDVQAASPTQPKHVSITPMRRAIAERMLTSQRATAPVTLTTTADATNLVNLRRQTKLAVQAGNDFLPTYTDILVKLTSLALQKHPLLNAAWVEDQIVLAESINIGIAVNLDDGLLVPVLRDVPRLSLRQISAQARQLIERARQRQLKSAEMEHGTFTLTNLGTFGIDSFTPIIHYPQCAILGLGRIQRRPVAVGEQVVIRDQITLCLTFDHRIVDGAPAAQFLQTLTQLVENPGPWLMS